MNRHYTRAKGISRRTVLRGAGVTIALPWLEIMGTLRAAHAQAKPAQRFVGVYTPGGTVLERHWPRGGETDFQLSNILEPLAPVRDKLLVLKGLDLV